MARIIGTRTIKVIKEALKGMSERVEQGGVLSKEEALFLMDLEELGISVSKIRGNDTRNEVLAKRSLVYVTDKYTRTQGIAMRRRNLPDCYDTVVCFQRKGCEKKYLKKFDADGMEYTTDLDEAKLFRSHIGFMGKGPDFDNYHTALQGLMNLMLLDDFRKYRPAKGSENFDDSIDHTKVVAESVDGKPRLTTVLIPTRSDSEREEGLAG